MDPSVAVAVRDEDITVRRKSRVAAAAERRATHEAGRLAGGAESQQKLAIERVLAHAMPRIVGTIQRAV